jgi:SET domain-containing protein
VLRPGDVVVRSSDVHGRGVFAARRFGTDDLIEECPVLLVGPDGEGPGLWEYMYEWTGGGGAVALGYGSLYNHSWLPNARYEQDYEDELIRLYAVQPIEEGEEITINYLGDPDGRGELWFEPR